MSVAEPMTMATDYALAAVTAALGWRLCRALEGQSSRRFWTVAFAALALAAALGGTYHGFFPVLSVAARALLWRVTVLAIGAANGAMVVGSAFAVTEALARRLLVAFAAATFALYAAWMLFHDAYRYVVADSAVAMLVLAVLHIRSFARCRDAASGWILGAVALSAVAAGVQASHVELAEGFNHNDLYHVLQIAAMALLYRGVAQLRDRAAGDARHEG